MTKLLALLAQAADWALNHKALIGSVLVAVAGIVGGNTPLGAAIAAILAAFSKGPAPVPTKSA